MGHRRVIPELRSVSYTHLQNKIKRKSIEETMKELDLTQGSVPKVLLQFAVPFLIANVLQALYGGADLFVVGQYDDSASVAAVAIGSQVMQTITGIILGITTGTTVLIAIALSLIHI